MMDHERQEKELQEVFEATQQAHRRVMKDTLVLQKRILELAFDMLESLGEIAQHQAESNRATLENLAEQSNKQWEAMEKLIRETTQEYAEVIKTPFSHHHQHHIGEDLATSEAQERPPEPRRT